MNGTTIIHLEFTAGDKAGQHHYFGSIAAIFTQFSAEEIGITAKSLYDFDIAPNRPYSNRNLIIRKGDIYRKKSSRKAPVKILRVID